MSSTPAVDLGLLLNLAFASFKGALDADLALAGYDDIGSSFGYVLRRLDEGPCSLTELARELAMTPPGALKVVDEMVAKGYVERSSNEFDRRVKRLDLTAKGRAVLKHARRFHQRYEQGLAERFGPAKVAAMRTVLESIVSSSGQTGRQRPRPV